MRRRREGCGDREWRRESGAAIVERAGEPSDIRGSQNTTSTSWKQYKTVMSGEMDVDKVGGYMELGDLLSAGLIIYISDPQCDDDINPVPPGKSSSLTIF